MEKRQSLRVSLITSGKVATLNSADSGSIYTANVSRQGLCFYSKSSLPIESEVVLELELVRPADAPVTEYLHGKVLWKREWNDLAAHGVHLLNPLSSDKTPQLLQHTMGAEAIVTSPDTRRAPAVRIKDPLTPREREVTRLIAKGLNNREMAERLSISTKTVETHRANIYAKLKVHNAIQLMRAIERSGRWIVNHKETH